MLAAEPYPWELLERLDAAPARASAAVRRVVGPVTVEGLCEALGTLLAVDAELDGRRRSIRRRDEAFSDDGTAVDLETAEGARLALWMELPLADTLLARLLRRTPAVARPGEPLGPELAGALTALCVETVRRAGASTPTQPGPPAPARAPGAVVRGTLRVDGAPYRVGAWVALDAKAPPRSARRQLGELDRTPLRLGLVGGHALLDRADLVALGGGDVVVPDDWPLELDAEGTPVLARGQAALWAPGADHGWAVSGSAEGVLVLTGDVAEAPRGPEATERAMSKVDESLAEALLSTPVVVQIEIGSVVMPAREWADLGPGDVIESGVVLGEPVTLRVAGVAVARGELVTIDGRVGVRIQQVTRTGRKLSAEADG